MDLKIKCTFLTILYQTSVSFCTHAGLSLWGGQIELHSVTSTCKARFHLQPLPLLSPLARPSLPQITVCLVPSHGSGRSSSNVTSSEMPYRATLAKIATLPCPRLWPALFSSHYTSARPCLFTLPLFIVHLSHSNVRAGPTMAVDKYFHGFVGKDEMRS